MGRPIILLGDTTSHGGKVVKTNQTARTINGIAIACVDDEVTCPITGHGKNKIVEGSQMMTIDGKAVALADCKTECGAMLQATLQTVVTVEK